MRDAWYPVLRSHELTAERPLPVKLFGDPLVLFRDAAGRPACFLDACPHRFVPLSLGKVRGGNLECAYHGWAYDGGGRCVRLPFLPEGQPIPRSAVACAYPCVEEDGAVWVWAGDPGRAGASPRPLPTDLPEGYELTNRLQKRIPARYDYVVEHVLDIPHFFQVHTATLLRRFPVARAELPEVVSVEESAAELTLRMRYSLLSRTMPVTIRTFRPCHMRVDLPLFGGRGYVFLFFNTPVDPTTTLGNMFVYRNFWKAPGVRQAVDHLMEKTFYTAIEEDMDLFAGQMANLAMGARSTTGYFFDAYLSRYHRWQRRGDAGEPWFEGFEEAMRRRAGVACAPARHAEAAAGGAS